MSGTTLAFAPLLSWELIAGLGAAVLLFVLFAAFRRARGWIWRLVAGAVLLLGLANPSLVEEEREGLADHVLVVVDESPSQSIEDRTVVTGAAMESLEERLKQLPNTTVEVVRAGAGEDGTNLFAAVREALTRMPRQQLAGIFLISDGQVHDVPESLASLAIDAPIHLLLSGRPDEGDRRLVVLRAPSYGIVDKPQQIQIEVEDQPGGGSGTAVLTLSQDGGSERSLTVPVGEPVTVEFELTRRGPSILELSVDEGPQELSLANNRAAIEVNGVRDRLRVLLVSGEPHAGERVWRNILKADPAVDLVHFTILRPPEKQDGTPIRELSLIAFPTRELFEEKLDEFDLIIFDRYRQRGVLPNAYLDNIARYVEEGGALLESAGPASASAFSLYRTPLGRIMPGEPTGRVLEEGFKPLLTQVGQRHPVTAGLSGSNAPEDEEARWGRWFRLVDAAVGDSGETLMAGPEEKPVLVLSRAGEGRVAQLFSDHVWLWARGFEGGGPQAELLRRTAHWLMQEPDLEEEDLRASIAGNRLTVTRHSLSPELVPVEVTLPDGTTVTLNLVESGGGVQSGTLTIDQSGLYRASDGERQALAAAGALNPKEFADLRATPELLAPLIAESNGGSLWLEEVPDPAIRKAAAGRDLAGRDWLAVLDRESYLVTGVSERPFLPSWAYLVLALGFAFVAWLREGR
ncbi:MAG TPA: hypothetical protein VJL84_03300 [Kiloniellales bacterium]|nr:hypothetical protein [Kiloniellales bacterium]